MVARLRTLLAILAVLVTAALSSEVRAGSPEYELKAEFVKRFASFTSWPTKVLPAKTDLVICIAHSRPMQRYLLKAARRGKIKRHSVTVRLFDMPLPVEGCHVLFISGASANALDLTLASLKGKAILTVSDTPGFAARGVMINMYQVGRRMKFEINQQAVKDAGLKLPAKVLRLGKAIRTR